MSDVPNITQNFARPSYRPAATTGGLDPDMRRMAIIAAGFGSALALVIGAFSLSHHVHHGIPVILADTRPVRIKPVNPGGMQVAGAEDIATGAERLAPAPEKPALHALHARAHHAAEPPAAAPAAQAAATPAAPAPAISAPPAIQHAAALAPIPATPATAGTSVQLAAFSTQQAAEQDWGKLAEQIPGLFNNHRPVVERAQIAGHPIFRLRTGNFANIAAATEFCGKVRAKGADCTIAAF
jgi:hypothetical protein